MDGGAKLIISLPNLWISFLEVLVSRWQWSHENLLQKRFFPNCNNSFMHPVNRYGIAVCP
jgi:hypothetical protein